MMKNWKISERTINIGDCYIDCGYIPRVCIASGEDLKGRSLIDNSVGFCSVHYCAPVWLHKSTARRWAKNGPINKALRDSLKAFYAGEWGNGRTIWWKE